MYVVLQRGKKTMEEPSPFTLLTVGQTTKESVVRAATTEPRWEQNFRFFVANPNHQNLDIEVSIISVASSAAAFEFASASNGCLVVWMKLWSSEGLDGIQEVWMRL